MLREISDHGYFKITGPKSLVPLLCPGLQIQGQYYWSQLCVGTNNQNY